MQQCLFHIEGHFFGASTTFLVLRINQYPSTSPLYQIREKQGGFKSGPGHISHGKNKGEIEEAVQKLHLLLFGDLRPTHPSVHDL